jgi:hypothetical protein
MHLNLQQQEMEQTSAADQNAEMPAMLMLHLLIVL